MHRNLYDQGCDDDGKDSDHNGNYGDDDGNDGDDDDQHGPRMVMMARQGW